jgi:hypothetical protein
MTGLSIREELADRHNRFTALQMMDGGTSVKWMRGAACNW